MDSIVNKPGTYGVYKKSAAGQFSLILPKFNDKGYMEREGSIMVEACASVGVDANDNPTYDWRAGKISFSLGMNDLALMFTDITKGLVHDYQGKLKTLQFSPGAEGTKYEGTYMMSLREKDSSANTERKVSVPLTGGEFQLLMVLIKSAPTKLLGW